MTKEPPIQISTVMLCWNRLSLSQRCLESYLSTVSVPYELCVVNNASSDGTLEWVDTLSADPRVTRCLHTERNDPAVALNAALEQCSGRYLHVMENDYIYREGWDSYVIDRFTRIPTLGQLCITPGQDRREGEHLQGLVRLARDNVVTSSVYPREIFFDYGVRYQSHLRGCLPNDVEFSMAVRNLGLLVAWPDRAITDSIGHSRKEWKRDPDYYIRDYKLRLFSGDRWLDELRNLQRFDPRDLMDDVGRLLKLYLYKARDAAALLRAKARSVR